MGSAGGDACSHCSRAGPELGTDGEGIGADEGSGSGSEPGASGSDERDPTGFRLLRQRDVRVRPAPKPKKMTMAGPFGAGYDR